MRNSHNNYKRSVSHRLLLLACRLPPNHDVYKVEFPGCWLW